MDKKFFLFLIFICIFSISAVNAYDNVTNDDGLNTQSDQIMLESDVEIGNFTQLSDEIGNVAAGSNMTLKKDYSYSVNDSAYRDGIRITKDNIVIDGGGHTIDGAGQARIFNITSSNVTLKNINFVNGHSSDGGAIFAIGNLNILNSTFYHNTAENSGGAIYFDDAGKIMDCTFDSNALLDEYGDGGAVYFNNVGTISNSIFTNNKANYSAGAVYFEEWGTVENSYFENNFADRYGGAIYLNNNGNISNCSFTNNSAKYDGGAVNVWMDGKVENSNFTDNNAQSGGSLYIHGAGEVTDCNFINNNARTGGAIELWGIGTIKHSNFTSNDAQFSGGAIYLNDNVKIDDCNFTDNSAGEYSGGALYIFGKGDITDSNFIDNSASLYGGAIYFNAGGTIVESTFKNNNASDGGAILACGNLVIDNSIFKDNAAISGTNNISLKENANIESNSSDVKNLGPFYVSNLAVKDVGNVTYGDCVKISVDVSYRENAINAGNVSVVIDKNRYSAEVVNGSATIEIPSLDAGSYDCEVVFSGAENYTDAIKNVKFNVRKQNLTLAAGNKAYVINYGGKYSVTVKDMGNNLISGVKVSFTLNAKSVGTATTNANGVATFKLTAKMLKAAKAGKRNLVIKTVNANYNTVSKTVKVSINKEKTKFTAKAKKFKRLSKTKKYSIILKNSKGKAVKKAKVTLKVKGKTFKATTNSKGKATFKITKLTKKGKFTATVKFKGNANYKPVSKKVKIVIK